MDSIIANSIIGKRLTAIYHTALDGPHIIENGLPHVYYFSIIFELENGSKYVLETDKITPWAGNEKLIKIDEDNWPPIKNAQYLNQKIKDIQFNKYNQCYLLLENDIVLHYTVDWGNGFESAKLEDYLKED